MSDKKLWDQYVEIEKERDELRTLLEVWREKTEWVQAGINDGTVPAKYLGVHRADVMKAEIDWLRSELKFAKAEVARLHDDIHEIIDGRDAIKARSVE